jgi:8-amino-7-oxononanoate synthase
LTRPRTTSDPTLPASAPVVPSPWSAWVDESCRVVAAAGQWRRPRTFDAMGPSGLLDDTGASGDVHAPVISFASNDYLGLASHPGVVAAAHRALDRWGSGSGASRLVTGSRPVHRELEVELASWKRCEQAVVFPTGFAANLSVLSVFGAEGAHVFSDELNHASIIDGCRMARAGVTIYAHDDLGGLDASLGASPGRPIIVSDTVFSMDGDEVDLEGLVEMAARHQALLVLDEAHAVLGPELTGGTRHGTVDILRVGTLSKTLGALGGFVAGPSRFVELLVNRARPYIFTTAPTPADAAAALAAVGIVRSDEGAALRARLAEHVARVAGVVGRRGHHSPIVPVIIGEETDAVSASSDLLAQGLWVPAIRPPTVPPGTSRLRITLSSIHTDQQVDHLLRGLVALGLGSGSDGQRAECSLAGQLACPTTSALSGAGADGGGVAS